MKQILRIVAWMWLIYLALLSVIDWFLYATEDFLALGTYYLINGSIAMIFLFFSHWSWIQRKLKNTFIPLMLVIIGGFSITASHAFSPQLPPGPLSNIEGLALRLLPILFIGLVIVAWHYPWPIIVLYSLGIAALQLLIQLIRPLPNFEPQIFVTMIQSVSFMVVGFFISRLIQLLNEQREDLAITNARLVNHAGTVEQLTTSRERNRMARELHDTLAHTLSGLSVQLETTHAYWDADPDTARELLKKSLAATRSGLNETRRALKALRASPIYDLGLRIALEKLAQSAAERGNFSLSLSLPYKITPLSTDLEQTIYRVTQEALENIVHHANASHVDLTLIELPERIELLIKDDGIGFEIGKVNKEGHFGLSGIKERAQIAGGDLMITSKPDQGTRIVLRLQGNENDKSNHL